jgi:hypothetical protein
MPVPYYPGSLYTPNLGLALYGMDEVLAENFVILDSAVTTGGTPGGTTGQVQYNNAGAFGGIAEGTAGWVLTSNGVGVPPSFQAISSGTSVLVNGSSITNPNFNDSTPAAPPGNTNVTWQVSGSSVSAYVPTVAPGGSDTQVQFNDGGVFGGSSKFTFVKATGLTSIAATTNVALLATNSGATPSTTSLNFGVNSQGRGDIHLQDSGTGTKGRIFFDSDGGMVLNPLSASASGLTINNVGISVFGAGGGAGVGVALLLANGTAVIGGGSFASGNPVLTTGQTGVEGVIKLLPQTGGGSYTLRAPNTGSNNVINLPNASGTLLEVSNPVDVTGQTASIGTTNLVVIAGVTALYRITYYMKITTAGSTSGSVTLTLSYTDRDDSAVVTYVVPTPANATDSSSVVSGTLIVDPKLVTNITYATTYASSGGTAMVYKLRLRAEAL